MAGAWGVIAAAATLSLAAALAPASARAQNPFAPALQVNNKVITWFELDQRARFYELLNAPGDPHEAAEERLTEERLQVGAAEAMGLSLTPAEVAAGEKEFAARANMEPDQFIAALAEGGVEVGTFRDFVTAGQLWRKAVRERFMDRVQVSDRDIDRELADTHPSADPLRLSYAEIILPADTPERKDEAIARAAELKDITGFAAFSDAARTYSAAPSAENGGVVPSAAARDMQPGLVQILISMAPGQVSDPLPIPNGIALLQLRGVGDGIPPRAADAVVDYAIWLIPGGRSPAALAEAAKVEATARSCNELYALNRRQRGPDSRLERAQAPISQVPRDIALELGHMDPGEYSTAITRGGQLALLMLCSRERPLPADTTRDQIRQQLQERQLTAFADAWLKELHDSAVIRRP